MGTDMIRGHLDLLVLAAVDQGADYGYAITELVRLRSDEAIELAQGSVYPALYRLEKAGQLESRPVQVNGRSRRVYKLTRGGRAALFARARKWASFSHAVGMTIAKSSPDERRGGWTRE